MDKKRIKIFIIALALVVVFIIAYILLLSKPKIVVKSVSVESLDLFTKPEHLGYMEGVNPVDSIEYFIERNRTYDDEDIQVFMQGDKLPSNDPNDYALVTLELEITNRTLFDYYCDYIMVSDSNDLHDSYFVTKPNVKPYVANRLSTTKDFTFKFYIYTKGKNAGDIEDFVRDLDLQFPFNNHILKDRNKAFSVEDNDEVIFSFDGISLQEQVSEEQTSSEQTTEKQSNEETTQQQTIEQITEKVEPLISQLMDKSTFKPNGKTPQLLKDVLLSNAEFTFVETELVYEENHNHTSKKLSERPMLLSKFNYWFDQFVDEVVPIDMYRVYDLDEDGYNEVVLHNPGGWLILHYEDNKVYGFRYFERGMNGIYSSGMFTGSAGAAYGTFSTMSFDKDSFKVTHASIWDNGKVIIDGKETTQDEYWKYLHSGKFDYLIPDYENFEDILDME